MIISPDGKILKELKKKKELLQLIRSKFPKKLRSIIPSLKND